ncbi:MAG: helicase-exonuclease AddAB subunit AddA [Clostridia bacterium]|nr:helicase-exonuclease AddAB subunit AddA [Clostridia bacterium]
MARSWTPEQKAAIEARGGSILVSAAAGSGKTAVLVERVIRRITDENNPCDVDRLLIATFTRAAAAEMRERLGKVIADGLKKEPDNRILRRQQLLLPNAEISTIDSFCSALIREHFEGLDISPDFRTPDEAEKRVMRDTAMETVLAKLYAENDEDFITLSNLLYTGRSDSELSRVIEKLYDNSRAYPFPDRWLDSLTDGICADSVEGTYFGCVLLSYVSDALKYCRRLNGVMYDAVMNENNEKLTSKLLPCILSDREQLDRLVKAAENGEWDALHNGIHGFNFVTKGIVPKEFKDSYVDTATKQLRKSVKDTVTSLKEYMCEDTDEFLRDSEYFRLPVMSLIRAVKLFDKEYTALKTERNALDFSDIEHMAIELLVTPTENGFEKAPLAEELSLSFDEILLDEYQDTNEAQDMLFRALSKNDENLFRVGDVKQCIYRFRQAMPEIFVRQRDSCAPYDGVHFPATICLGSNFRSRKEVTDTVNFIFSLLMSRSCGDVDYGEGERLHAAASYAPSDDKTSELHLLTLDKNSDKDKDVQQAEYVARLVREILESGMTVTDGDSVRPVKAGDICILMRSFASRGMLYADELKKLGIGSAAEASSDFLGATEIAVMLSLLRIIDNPCQDIPLISVLLSPMYGFTPDELSLLRTDSEGDSLYARAVNLASNGNTRFASFIESINSLRLYSTSLCTHELIRKIYEQTGYFAAMGAMDNAAKRKANLSLLVRYAADYESQGYIGLSGFIRFIDKLPENEKTLSGALDTESGADAVKIMTVHKSKGLEFPVVILASCSTAFNTTDENGCAVIDPIHGIGIKMRSEATLAQFDTVSHTGARLSLKRSRISEEMRILYVALTRAKEKLIMVCADKEPEKKLMKLGADIIPGQKADPFCTGSAKSLADWILSAFLRHKDCAPLREAAGLEPDAVYPGEGGIILKLPVYIDGEQAEVCEEAERTAAATLTGEIRERLSYRYKYESLFGLLTKQTASGVLARETDFESFATSRPAFMNETGLTAAQKGTAVHRFMELCDYKNAETDISGAIERLVSSELMTRQEADAVNLRKVNAFFSSDIYRRIKASHTVYREKRFLIEVPLNEIYDGLPDFIDEKQIIQGVADCAFVEDGKLVIVDYKTDRVNDEKELVQKYTSQLEIYKKALALCTGLEVKQTLLWSFYMEKEVPVFSE